MEKDDDGRVRRMPVNQQGLITFPMAAANAKVGHAIKTPPGELAWIDYAGGIQTIPNISFPGRDGARRSQATSPARGGVRPARRGAAAGGDQGAGDVGGCFSISHSNPFAMMPPTVNAVLIEPPYMSVVSFTQFAMSRIFVSVIGGPSFNCSGPAR